MRNVGSELDHCENKHKHGSVDNGGLRKQHRSFAAGSSTETSPPRDLPSSSSLVTRSLKRPTTIPNFIPVPITFP